MLVKLESPHGGALHALEMEFPATPPDVLLVGKRVFRFVRTDGVWDRKSQVYREATIHKAGAAASRKLNKRLGELAAAPAELARRA